MRLKFGKKTAQRLVSRLTKKIRIRKTVKGTSVRPRLCAFRSSKNMYAQIIDDVTGNVLVSASSLQLKIDASGVAQAEAVGSHVAKLALEKNITSVVFDRNGFIYHGRVKSLADGAREGGLSF